jgi:aryl-alcohol dehydrogenase-like predicted oxidoreductase
VCADVLEYCEREGIAFIPWAPIDAGFVSDVVLAPAAVSSLDLRGLVERV